jgi:hypothetical protein
MAAGIALVIVLGAAGALLASGHQVAATVVGIGGAVVVMSWRKVLAKLGVRSSR